MPPKKKGSGGVKRPTVAERKGYTPEEFRTVCAAVRTAYLANRKIPGVDEVFALCNLSRGKIARVLSTESFVEAMEITGIPWRKTRGLTAQQHYALVIMTDPNDRRNFQQRLKDIGCTVAQWKSWLKNPVFHSLISQFAENALGDHMTAAHMSLLNQVDKGNMTAVQLYYQMTGRWDPTAKVERDIQAVIAQVIEIIQRNVTDQTALTNIATELSALMRGPQPVNALPAARMDEVIIDEVDPSFDFDAERAAKYESEGWVNFDHEPVVKQNKTERVADLEAKLDAGIAQAPSLSFLEE